jgi:hypothetical protein
VRQQRRTAELALANLDPIDAAAHRVGDAREQARAAEPPVDDEAQQRSRERRAPASRLDVARQKLARPSSGLDACA